MIQVSVVVPTYNRLPVLRRTVACLQQQTFDPERYEIIVVDDQSTDGTWAWLQEMQAEDGRLIVLRNPKKGRGQARNAGIAVARGEIICFVDDDVWVVPEFVQAHWEAHQEHGPRAVIIGALDASPETRPTIANLYQDARLARVEARIRAAGDDLHPGFFRTGNVSVRAVFLRQVGGFDESFTTYSYEDSELGYRLLGAGGQFRYCPPARGCHFTDTSIADILRKSAQAGESAVVFLRRCPAAAGSVPAPYSVPGVPQTRRSDGMAKRAAKWLYATPAARLGLSVLLWLSLLTGPRALSYRVLALLSGHYYAVAFRRATQAAPTQSSEPAALSVPK